jgi:hypothetical protein
MIAEAVLPLGLPQSSLPEFIGDLANNNFTALTAVPGVTPQIIGAGVGGLFDAYALAFRYVWIAAGCFTVAAVICKSHLFSPINITC